MTNTVHTVKQMISRINEQVEKSFGGCAVAQAFFYHHGVIFVSISR